MKAERIFELTAAAIEQIGLSATRAQGKPALRVAAKRIEDGSFAYGIGSTRNARTMSSWTSAR